MRKLNLHPRNKHNGRYDFDLLIQASPALATFVKLNAYNDTSIDFANPQAVKALNKALLIQHYNILDWDIPAQYLCPPIPGRADYVHYLADLLAETNHGKIPPIDTIRVLDIGVGANAIYPLIGHREYGWRFVGADIDATALANAQQILHANAGLTASIELRLQASPTNIFKGIIQPDDFFNLTLCNPPFHASLAEAQAGTQRKWQNLGINTGKSKALKLNFGGQSAELYCDGGEVAFVSRMIEESVQFKNQCTWFTSLISKAASLPSVYSALKKAHALKVKTIAMAQGQKQSRIVAWSFFSTK
ncbi:MAG: 23S rRNA (adenine(1618)-N(6))-methyltransferase RlmF [Methylotenera sp.]|nr:23S rRNA (adenine(1618)-N(6))-methyltransferase RlmF [Methylotenera sp.]MDD4925420.1 23S rRNA (adenine(1618)-N(6))-methyltransferase RlmF [Methylotenera sp.]